MRFVATLLALLLSSAAQADISNNSSFLYDSAGNGLTSQASSAQRALDVGIDVAGVQIDPRSVRLLTSSDVITADQGGTWNITNITGTVSLPTGAATAANQTNVQSAVGSSATTAITVQGSASGVAVPVSAASLPLPTGASTSNNQTNGSQKTQVVDASGNSVTTQANGTARALDVGIDVAGVQVDPRSIRALTASDVVTAQQGGAPWSQNVTQFGGSAVVTGTGASGSGIPRVTVSNDSKVIAWDGTNTTTVKAASAAPAAADTALVVAQSPTSPFSFFHPVYTTRVQSALKATTANSTSLATTINGTGSGNLIVVSVNCNTTTAPTVTDSASQTYTNAVSISSGTSINYIFYKANTASGVTSVTVSDTTSTAINVVIAEYSGIATTTPLDQTHSTATTAATAWTSGATSATTQASELLIGSDMTNQHANTTQIAGTNYDEVGYITNTGAVNMVDFLEEDYVSATGTYAATGTASQNDNNYALIATFKTATLPAGFTIPGAATVIKSGAGTLSRIVINTLGTGSAIATFYDGTSTSGTEIGSISLTSAVTTLYYDLHFSTGLTMVVSSSTGDFTVVYN